MVIFHSYAGLPDLIFGPQPNFRQRTDTRTIHDRAGFLPVFHRTLPNGNVTLVHEGFLTALDHILPHVKRWVDGYILGANKQWSGGWCDWATRTPKRPEDLHSFMVYFRENPPKMHDNWRYQVLAAASCQFSAVGWLHGGLPSWFIARMILHLGWEIPRFIVWSQELTSTKTQ